MSLKRFTTHKTSYFWWGVVFVCMVLLSLKYPVGQKLNLAAAPLIHALQAPVRWVHEASLWFQHTSELQRQVLSLQEQVAKQAVFQQRLTTLATENKQLRQLLHITHMDGYVWQAARVISRSQEEKSRRLMIQAAGVSPDDIVISHEGLVGLVDEVGMHHALVRTILDASIAVPVTKAGSRLAALVRGDGEHLQVDFIPRDKAPQKGDVLVASGAGGVFPAGLPVAVVEQVRAVPGGVFVEVIATPVAYWQHDAWLAVVGRQHAD